MKTNRREFIKRMNWGLAGIIGMLGFGGCEKIGGNAKEYGTPHADYTVKGKVVNKATGKPIEGIRVGYGCNSCPVSEYGLIPTPFTPKSHVLTNVKGEYKLTDSFFPENNLILPVYVEDIDGEKNGSFQSEILQVDFSKAERTGKPNSWYSGEYTVNVNVELTENGKE
jgi:putative lipoprotein (rSAM/lipoprotein system)